MSESMPVDAYETKTDRRVDHGLPANIDAEKTILGAILLDNAAFLEAAEKLHSDDFSLESHRRIFLRMTELIEENTAVDIVTLANTLSAKKEVEGVGGVAYLASLTEGLPRRPVIADYIRIVKDKSLLRKTMAICSYACARAADQSESGFDIIGIVQAQLEDVIDGGVQQGLASVSDITVDVLDRFLKRADLDQSPGFKFGIPKMDEATGGIQKGQQCVIGSVSGVGKTTILAQIVAENCSKGVGAAMFLVEPSRDDFLPRLWSIVADVPYNCITAPWTMHREQRDMISRAAMMVAEWPLFIFDKSSLTIDEVVPHSRLAMHKHDIGIIGVDYLQRLAQRSVGKDDSRMRLETARASIALADLVKDTETCSVVLSQLNRSSDMNAIPTMTRLRESGQIENDAHLIALMHLEYDEEQGHFLNQGMAIIPKQRFGIPTSIRMYKDPRTALWVDREPVNYPDWHN